MATVAVFSLLIGSLLGGRFRIFILPPVAVLGSAILGIGSAMQGHDSAHILMVVLVFGVLLQIGYLSGAGLSRVQAPAGRDKAAEAIEFERFG